MKLTREQQIELMEGAAKRVDGHIAAWLARPDVRAAFRRWMADLKRPEPNNTGGSNDRR